MARVLIAGCGYVGAALGARLALAPHEVWGLRRRNASLPVGVRPIVADLAVPRSLRELPPRLDVVVYMASAGGPDEALYRAAYVDGVRNLLAALSEAGQKPRRLLFVSSTGVYAQSRGEWVDESSPAEPAHFSGRRLLEGESLVRQSGLPHTIVRFGGIYGPRRTRLVDRVREARAFYREGQYTNRIHRDDCAGALEHLIGLPEPEPLYLGVDCEPADEQTVYSWLAGVLGAPSPRPERRRGGRAARPRGNKRCRNDRLLDAGYRFRFPTFREGYADVLAGM